MARDLSFNLHSRQTLVLAVTAAAVAIVAASQLRGIASFTASFVAFCSNVLVADWGNGGADVSRSVALAAWGVLGVSAIRSAAFVGKTVLEGAALRRRIGTLRAVSSGKVVRAALSVGMDAPTVVDDTDAYAFTAGLLRPDIVISSALVSRLSLGELKAVLRHERHHQLRRDPLRTFVGELARTSFFWMPILRDVTDHFALGREIRADRAAIVGGARKSRRVLASALLKTAPAAVPAFSHAVSFGQFSHRVDALAYPSDRTPLRIATWRLAATVGILAALLAGGNAGAAADAGPARLCVDAAVVRTGGAGFTPFVLIMSDAAPMSEAGQATPNGR